MYNTNSIFFDNDFLQDVISALIGTGTALIIFYLTLRADKRKERDKKMEENQNRIRNFSNLLNSSKEHVSRIIINIQEMIDKYEINLLDFQLLIFIPNKSLERLDKLLINENYFLAFVEKFGESRVMSFNLIASQVDLFNVQIEQLFEVIRNSQLADFKRKSKFNDEVNELMNITAGLTKKVNLLNFEDIKKLENLIIKFYEDLLDSADLEYYYKFIRLVLEDILINYTGNPEILAILPKFRDTSALFQEIKLQNKYHKEELIQIKKVLDLTHKKYTAEIEKTKI